MEAKILQRVLLSILITGCSRTDSSSNTKSPDTPLVATGASSRRDEPKLSNLDRDLLGRFQALNPAINSAHVSSIMAARGHYVAIANGRAPNARERHEDRFTNLAHAEDIFGVFMLDHDLTKVTRQLGLFISPRLGDYAAWIIRTTQDSVIVCGRGDTYGDSQARWAFALDSARSAESARVRDSVRIVDSILRMPPPGADPGDYEHDEPVSPPPDCPESSPK